MRKIEFHDRGSEIKEIMRILKTAPTLITFIYGPINSGKTELINHVISQLPEEYAVFYINLRGRFIRSYEEFLDVLFEIDEERKVENAKEYAKAILKDLKTISGIPIPINLFERIFERKERGKDVFKYIETIMNEISEKYVPVLILDEMQVIGDVKINELLIYKLFNFFIRLTKEMHLCHVFAITSDSLFIERVYSEAMLQGRCRYLLVDDFDYETTMDFLNKHNLSDEEKEVVWNYCGGKPVCLLELLNSERRKKKAKEMLRIRIGQIEQRLQVLKVVRKKILFEGEEIEIRYEDVMKILERFSESESYECVGIMPEVTYLIKENILFFDPVNGIIKPQSRLDLLAIREILQRKR